MSERWTVEHILDTMHEMYRDFPLTELQYETPFQCLIAVMMSAETTDIQVNKVTDTLFKKIKNPADVLELGYLRLGEYIRTLGLRTAKQKNIWRTAEILVAESGKMSKEGGVRNSLLRPSLGEGDRVDCENCHSKHEDCHPEPVEGCDIMGKQVAPFDSASLHSGGQTQELTINESQRQGQEKADKLVCKDSAEVLERYGYWLPDTLEGMMELPGVGVKTAKVVLYVLYRQRRVAVDTHVHRVMNRLGVITTTTPDQSSTQLETIIPDEYKDIAHHSIIYFGRYHCKAKKPKCGECSLREKCRWYEESL